LTSPQQNIPATQCAGPTRKRAMTPTATRPLKDASTAATDAGMSLHAASKAVLAECAATITGSRSTPPRPGQARLLDDICAAFDTPAVGSEPGGLVAGEAPTGTGKALDVDTPIPTPAGWTRIGDLVPGDEVFDETGRVCRVTHAFDVRLDRPCYEVTFDDGSKIVADGEHLWTTSTRKSRALDSEHKRALARPLSGYRLERYRKLLAVADTIADQGWSTTLSEAATLLSPFAGATEIGKERRRLGGHALRRNERFDLRPVLASVIARASGGSALAGGKPSIYSTRTTFEIAATLRGQSNALNHALPVNAALDLPHAILPIDPYVFGAWLGDGTSRNSGFTCADQEIIDEIQRRGYHVKTLDADRYKHSIHLTESPANNRWADSFTHRLVDLGVRADKHIPVKYLRASFDQRLDLLRGLIDTDGTVSTKTGRVEISLTNERLSLDVLALVRSLGIKTAMRTGLATITQDGVRRPTGTRWRIGFTTDLQVAALTRKACLLPSRPGRATTRTRYIANARPVPTRPVRCIAVDSPSHLFLAGESLVATHNSLAYLCPASVAASRGERTVVSTEMISLQNQIIVKDAPVVADACEKVTGYRPRIALLKGWSNFGCPAAALDIVREYVHVPAGLDGIEAADYALKHAPAVGPDALTLPTWVLRETLSMVDAANAGGVDHATLVADKDAYPATFTEAEWSKVSIASGDCLGKQCPFFQTCPAGRAKQIAAEADIVVTNHHLIAVQAAKRVPVVTGSERMGEFHHLVIDEAHGLPPIVRDMGAVEISARTVRNAARAVGNVFSDQDPQVSHLLSQADRAAALLESELGEWTDRLKPGEVATLAEADDPVEGALPMIKSWAESARRMLRRSSGFDAGLRIKALRARNRIDSLLDALDQVGEHRLGTARWVENVTPHARPGHAAPDPYPAAKSTPVEVGHVLRDGLWTVEDIDAEKSTAPGPVEAFAENTAPAEPAAPRPRRWLTVVAISATVPRGFTRQMGLKVPVTEYESPFESAYGNSVLYVPRAVDPEDVAAVGWAPPGANRGKFDVAKHQVWATSKILDLVTANAGSALVLSATARSGREYAERLRAKAASLPASERFAVHSQWDGLPLRRVVAAWKADIGSVLVGTRSLMTGVDASGETCTLVIVDRPARAASNPVDDARAAAIREASQMDKWAADRLVYVADASTRLAQSVGRLIRAIDDAGMVAVLDPRLLKSGPYSYPEPTRREYGAALRHFPNRLTRHDDALNWLRTHRAGTAKAA
jgi:ATP-dependent DNA helicase DinG